MWSSRVCELICLFVIQSVLIWFLPLADIRACTGETVRSLENACYNWAP